MLAAVPCFMIGWSLNACTVISAWRIVRTLYRKLKTVRR
jgi:hypothetical protein